MTSTPARPTREPKRASTHQGLVTSGRGSVFTNILCAVDGTRASTAAVKLAASLAGPDGHLTLLAVTAVSGSGAYATAVKVRAADRVGLLYDLARAFADSDLQIRWARAVTQSGVAKDVFHVTDATGEPVDDPGVLGHLAMRIRERV